MRAPGMNAREILTGENWSKEAGGEKELAEMALGRVC
jgi:hypothetical protein